MKGRVGRVASIAASVSIKRSAAAAAKSSASAPMSRTSSSRRGGRPLLRLLALLHARRAPGTNAAAVRALCSARIEDGRVAPVASAMRRSVDRMLFLLDLLHAILKARA